MKEKCVKEDFKLAQFSDIKTGVSAVLKEY